MIHRTQHRATLTTAFTLVEMLLVLVLIGMVSSLVVPRYANVIAQQQVDATARRIIMDLERARTDARFSSTAREVNFFPVDNYYVIPNTPDPDHPMTTEYRVDVDQEPYLANLVSAQFGGDANVLFDGYGEPDSGGTVVVQVGKYLRTITFNGGTKMIVILKEIELAE